MPALTSPTARTPGWTREDYAGHGVSGRDRQRLCRRWWLPPQVVGALRADTDMTWLTIESLAQRLPLHLLALIAERKWASDSDLLVLLTLIRQTESRDIEQWIRCAGGAPAACLELLRAGVDLTGLAAWGAVSGIRRPADVLAPIWRSRLATFGLPAAQINDWLLLAVRSTGSHSFTRAPLTCLVTDHDPLFGGRTALYAAAGISVSEALQIEKPRAAPVDRLPSLVGLAALRGHLLPAADSWAQR